MPTATETSARENTKDPPSQSHKQPLVHSPFQKPSRGKDLCFDDSIIQFVEQSVSYHLQRSITYLSIISIMGEGKAFDEAINAADAKKNSSFGSNGSEVPPSAPPLEEDANLPVATPLNAFPGGGGGNSTTQDTTTPTSTSTPEGTQKKAAGIAAAVVGFFLGGPFLSILLGGGTYYAATHRPEGDAAGDAARSLGDVALVVRDRANELNDKHDLVNKGKNAAGSLWQKSKAKGEELDAKHDIVNKGKNLMERVLAKAIELNNEHRILERTKLLLGNILTAIANKLSDGTDAPQQQRQAASGGSS